MCRPELAFADCFSRGMADMYNIYYVTGNTHYVSMPTNDFELELDMISEFIKGALSQSEICFHT